MSTYISPQFITYLLQKCYIDIDNITKICFHKKEGMKCFFLYAFLNKKYNLEVLKTNEKIIQNRVH